VQKDNPLAELKQELDRRHAGVHEPIEVGPQLDVGDPPKEVPSMGSSCFLDSAASRSTASSGRKAVCINSMPSMPAYFMSAKMSSRIGVMSLFG